MISIKRYLEGNGHTVPTSIGVPDEPALQAALRRALRSVLTGVGNASIEASATSGAVLRAELAVLEDRMAVSTDAKDVARSEDDALRHLRDWGARSAEHLHVRTGEVKDILLVLARTAELDRFIQGRPGKCQPCEDGLSS